MIIRHKDELFEEWRKNFERANKYEAKIEKLEQKVEQDFTRVESLQRKLDVERDERLKLMSE